MRFELITCHEGLFNVNPTPVAEAPAVRVYQTNDGWYIGAAMIGGRMYLTAVEGAKVPRRFSLRDNALRHTISLIEAAAEAWAANPGLYR